MVVSARFERSLRVLGADKVRAIHEASLRVLSETGLTMPLAPQRQAQARELGLLVDSETRRICFPPEIVAQALASAPSSYTLCARNPEDDVLLDGKQSYLSLDGNAVQLVDLESGELRSSVRADLEAAVRVADALDSISILCPALSAADCAPRMQPVVETAALLTGSSKHAQAMTVVDPASAETAVQMAAEIAGGPDALRQRPILSGFQCSISPLSYDAGSLEATFATGAKEIDWQAGVENALSGVMSLLAGADIVFGAGLLQAAKVFSFEQLLLDCEIFDMLRHLSAGIPVDPESLAVEVIEAVGPGGHFMEQEHTLRQMRKIWQPALLDRMPLEAWKEAGRPTALGRARERAREILATHEPDPLRCEQQIREIVLAREGNGQ